MYNKLNLNTEIIGRKILYFPTIDSTNNYLINNKKNLEEGTVVIAEHQTAGRGRHLRKWHSTEDKMLQFSIIFHPTDIKNILLYVHLASYSVINSLFEVTKLTNYQIKYPNDILLDNKKCCGILIETIKENNQLYLIMGIGININQQLDDFTPELRNIATSIYCVKKEETDRQILLTNLVHKLDYGYKQLKENKFTEILNIVKKHSIILGKRIQIDNLNPPLNGIAIDFDSNGSLVIKKDDGTIVQTTQTDLLYLI